MLADETKDPISEAFELAKLQAATDGAFDERLLRFWFESAWEQCAAMVGFVWPPQEIRERIVIRADGSFRLSYRPSSEVRIYEGANLVMTLPRSLERSHCDPALCECCTCCGYTAHYWVGDQNLCQFPVGFVQAVARLFTFMVENRGDIQQDDRIMARCGALPFLSATGGVAYVV